MKNVLVCGNCSTENSYFKHICADCGSFLRTKVENIDFWSAAWNLFASPGEVFGKIIHAEHKNYIFVLSVIAAVKYFIIISFTRNILEINILNISNYFINIFISIFSLMVLTSAVALVVKGSAQLFKLQTRFKDNFSIIVYSFVPIIFALIFLFPVQYALFGPKFFSFVPSPFLLNYNTALILSLVDALMALWTLLLMVVGFKVQSNSWGFGIITGILIFCAFSAAALFSPLFL